MLLIIWFLALVAAGDVLSYLVGLFVEYEWGAYPSLVVFLAMYFITLWVAWRIAVWLTRPKPASTSSGRLILELGPATEDGAATLPSPALASTRQFDWA